MKKNYLSELNSTRIQAWTLDMFQDAAMRFRYQN